MFSEILYRYIIHMLNFLVFFTKHGTSLFSLSVDHMSILMLSANSRENPRCLSFCWASVRIYIRSTPHPLTVTTRIITFLVGNPYKASFATVTGWGVDPIYRFAQLRFSNHVVVNDE